MSFAFDVFVSYSRKDPPFVEGLVAALKSAGFRTWFDIEQVPLGADVQKTLREALAVSQHVIAVITESWLASDFATWEISVFQESLLGDRVLLPLARMAPDAKTLGPYLHRRNALTWLEGDPEPDARFWQVYCGLLRKGPGPRAEWAQNGRNACTAGGGSALFAASAEEKEARTAHRAHWGPGRAVFGCDRERQWTKVEAHADQSQHEALFVIGPRGEGHGLFLDTLHECYPAAPPRRIFTVQWSPGVPSSRGDFRAELAVALGCEEADLARTMRAHLRDQNLVLLHRPVVAASLRDEGLIRYYTRWLPELVGELGTTGRTLKAVQAIDWSPAGRLTSPFARLAGRLGIGGRFGKRDWVEEAVQQDEATRALERICREADTERLPIVPLEPLPPITREDVEAWSGLLPPGVNRAEIVRDVLRGAKDSADILHQIAERLGA